MPYVTRDGVSIYFECVGTGYPLVLHTGGGGDGRMWQQAGYVDALSGDFQCILMDHRGHGRSGKPTEVKSHEMEEYAADVVAIMDAVGVSRAAFWGYSAGNPVGLCLAAAHPARVAGLVLLGGVIETDYCDPSAQEYQQEWADIGRERGVGSFVSGMRAHDGMDFPRWFMEQMESTEGEMFALQVEGALRWRGPWSLFDQITCPVLLIAGELEDPDEDNAKVAAALPTASSVTIEGLGHVGAFVRSDLTLTHALPFLRDLNQSTKQSA